MEGLAYVTLTSIFNGRVWELDILLNYTQTTAVSDDLLLRFENMTTFTKKRNISSQEISLIILTFCKNYLITDLYY